ncbi:MAG: hypothetical protein ABIH37_00395 [archaeon]
MKSKILSLTAISMLFLVSFVLADVGDEAYGDCWSGMGSMMNGSYGVGGTAFGWGVGVLILVVLVLLIIWLVKQIQSPKKRK